MTVKKNIKVLKDETSGAQKIDFENDLNALQNIVEKMEKGDLTLEDALEQFENGIKLTRRCQKALKDAEQKVQILIQQNQQKMEESLESYDSESDR